nr:hypothetical protein [uncultured Methanoregula sp.]
MQWLSKYHPELANAGLRPVGIPGIQFLGAYGMQLGPITIVDSVLDVDQMLETIAHEKMHALDGPKWQLFHPALGLHHALIGYDALQIKQQYLADPNGTKPPCDKASAHTHVGGAGFNDRGYAPLDPHSGLELQSTLFP